MKRYIRRAVVVAGLITVGFGLHAPSAGAGTLCARATAFVGGSGIPLGTCVQNVGPLPTDCVTVWDTTVAGYGAGAQVCVPA